MGQKIYMLTNIALANRDGVAKPKAYTEKEFEAIKAQGWMGDPERRIKARFMLNEVREMPDANKTFIPPTLEQKVRNIAQDAVASVVKEEQGRPSEGAST